MGFLKFLTLHLRSQHLLHSFLNITQFNEGKIYSLYINTLAFLFHNLKLYVKIKKQHINFI